MIYRPSPYTHLKNEVHEMTVKCFKFNLFYIIEQWEFVFPSLISSYYLLYFSPLWNASKFTIFYIIEQLEFVLSTLLFPRL